ncbi:MAG: SUF system NifU family Fe-S cluster assembly protein [SAR202 cluster bacterium]|nr:SUF system NifU family Fe-S cluster assembly protein [SAR202 cluster bacterium]
MSDLVDLYQEMVLDHNNRPRNFQKLEDASNTADGYNPLCGDQISVYLKVEDGVIADVGFQGVGCAISKSSASMMTQSVKGKTVEEAEALFQDFHAMVTREPGSDYDSSSLGELEVLSGVCAFPNRIKCASLAWHTLTASLNHKQDGPATTE